MTRLKLFDTIDEAGWPTPLVITILEPEGQEPEILVGPVEGIGRMAM
jgi:hypothetical protein